MPIGSELIGAKRQKEKRVKESLGKIALTPSDRNPPLNAVIPSNEALDR
jgi:hypothetical protein